MSNWNNFLGKSDADQQPSRSTATAPNSGTHSETLCNAEELIGALSLKRARLHEWIQNACAYYAQNDYSSFVRLLESAIPCGSQAYGGYKEDLLRVHTLLAAHFVRLACCEVSSHCAEWRQKIVKLMRTMDDMKTLSNDLQYLLCRGFALMFLETRLQEAESYFTAVLRHQPNHIHALLGRGCLAYNRQEYRVALGYFKSLLLYHPHGPADVRIGIAHCFLKLDNRAAARKFFELALAHNGRCQNALIGMAQLKYTERLRDSNLEAINLLCAAFELNMNHPLVLLWLAGYFYYSHNYEKLHLTAGGAIRNTNCKLIQAQAYFQIARGFHRMGNYDRAFDFYGNAMKLCPVEFAPPHLGVAQMYVRRGQLDKAEHSLRTLLKLMPQQAEALRMLATLYTEAESCDMLDVAIQLFKKALERSSKDDYNIYIGLATAYERKKLWQQAIDMYKQAMLLYNQQEVPLTWLNNLGVVQLNANAPEEALISLEKALSIAGMANHEKDVESTLLTIRYNKARVLEKLHQTDKAELDHQLLISEYPPYYDSYIRLAVTAFNRNQVDEAIKLLKAVLKLDDDNTTARIFLANYYTKQGNVPLGMYHYNVLLRSRGEDPYICIAMGNAWLTKMQRAVAAGNNEIPRENREKALQYFKMAADKGQHNLWAANGIGIILSSYDLVDAEPIFKLIVSSKNTCTDAKLNMAHTALGLKQYTEAIEIYKQCFQEFLPRNNVETIQLLAKAHFHAGQIREAKQLLLKARHVAPQNQSLLYNLAAVIVRGCSDTFNQTPLNLSKLRRADRELHLAKSFFDYVGQHDELLRPYASRQAVKCRMLLDNVPEELKRERQQQRQIDISKSRQEQTENELESNEKKLITDEDNPSICTNSVNEESSNTVQYVEMGERTGQVITETINENVKKSKKKKHKSKSTHDKEMPNVLEHFVANTETASRPDDKTHKRKHKSKKEASTEFSALMENQTQLKETADELSAESTKRKQNTKEFETENNHKTKKKK